MSYIVLKIILFIVASYGLTFGLVYTRGIFGIFEKIRNISERYFHEVYEMLQCTFCTPCNIGLWSSIINIVFFPTIPITPAFLIIGDASLWIYIILADTFFVGASVFLIDTIQSRIEKKEETETEDE